MQKTSNRRWFAVLVGVALLGAIGLLGSSPAQAHAKLVSSSPANGSSLTTAPAQVVLTFDEAVTVNSVRATTTLGDTVNLGSPTVSGSSVTVDWPAGQAPGLYRLGYNVTSDDGHVVEGILLFSYSQASTASPSPTSDGGQTSSSSISPLWGALLIAAGLALILAAIYALRKSRAESR